MKLTKGDIDTIVDAVVAGVIGGMAAGIVADHGALDGFKYALGWAVLAKRQLEDRVVALEAELERETKKQKTGQFRSPRRPRRVV